jgi:hypothetical protein
MNFFRAGLGELNPLEGLNNPGKVKMVKIKNRPLMHEYFQLFVY